MLKKNLTLPSILLIMVMAAYTATGFVNKTPLGNPATSDAPTKKSTSLSLNLTLGNPSQATTSASDKENFLLVKPQFVLSYNNKRGGPNWVSWHLQKSDIGTVDRQDNFHPEADLPDGFKRVTPADYTGSGFDRGHMCNSKDRTRTEADNSETFSMANMLPQTPALNRHVWEKLEAYSRTLATEGNELYIVAGCYGSKKTIGKDHKVTVPTNCWKIVVVMRQGQDDLSRIDASTRVIAVNMPNKNGIDKDRWQKYITTVRDVEKSTKYDFLSEVPQAVQDVIETRKDSGKVKASVGKGK